MVEIEDTEASELSSELRADLSSLVSNSVSSSFGVRCRGIVKFK